jgi:2-dehydro-3-deoxyphosphogluconate aldolase/(4S)-4-hydroxy-2-oxoglutarate aldolase
MLLNREQILHRLSARGVVAVIRADSIDGLIETTRALVAGGVTSVELTMTTPNALEGIRQLARTFGDAGEALIGVGTVMDVATVREAVSIGAQYVVSPHFDPQVVEATRDLGKVSIPGAFTPNEILAAHRAGADIVKIFPSGGLSPSYFRDVLAPLPFLKLIPTGGVDEKNAGDWIKAGAVCVGAGTQLVPKDAVKKKDWAEITRRAKAFVDAVKVARAA